MPDQVAPVKLHSAGSASRGRRQSHADIMAALNLDSAKEAVGSAVPQVAAIEIPEVVVEHVPKPSKAGERPKKSASGKKTHAEIMAEIAAEEAANSQRQAKAAPPRKPEPIHQPVRPAGPMVPASTESALPGWESPSVLRKREADLKANPWKKTAVAHNAYRRTKGLAPVVPKPDVKATDELLNSLKAKEKILPSGQDAAGPTLRNDLTQMAATADIPAWKKELLVRKRTKATGAAEAPPAESV